MGARRRTKPSRTPLDDIQRKLEEEQETLEKTEEKLKRFIEEAPRIAAERQKARREALMTDRGSRGHRFNATTLADPRYDQWSEMRSSAARRRPLKSEKRQTRLIFLGLLLLLGVLVIWLLSVWHGQWPG